MRKIETTTRFGRDYRREAKGQYRSSLEPTLSDIILNLAQDDPLPVRLQDHALTGTWNDHRDCHIKPDLVLIYRKPNPNTLQLVRLGSHSELDL